MKRFMINNLLYPWVRRGRVYPPTRANPRSRQADKVNPEVLLLKCRHCGHKEETTNPCVYQHTFTVATQ
ncbi:hypothetical protein JCM1841_007075 [Sporobolomyces salmonicolor]